MSDYKAGQEIRVEFHTVVPIDATYEQVMEWLEFELMANGTMPMSNPLSEHGLDRSRWVEVR